MDVNEGTICKFTGCEKKREVSRYYVNVKGERSPLYRRYCSKHKKFVYGRYKELKKTTASLMEQINALTYGCGCLKTDKPLCSKHWRV